MSMRPEPCSGSAADTAATPRETETGSSLFPRAVRTPAENSSAAASTAAEDRVKPRKPGASLAFFDVAFRWYGLYNLCYTEPSLHTMITCLLYTSIETVAAQAETFLEAHRMEDKRTLGEYIAQRRRALGMTQRQFAEKLYVTDSAVSKWERGLSYPCLLYTSRCV